MTEATFPQCRIVTERLLKEKFPGIQTSRFRGKLFSVSAEEPERIQEFEDWLKGVDAVIAAVGD